MHLVDDGGRALAAEYLVEADGGHLAVILESRSGMSGSRLPHNPDYNRALTVLLTRLGTLNAVLVDAMVDSRRAQQLGTPEADRRLIQTPVRLAREPDVDALRRRMGSAQARIARSRMPPGQAIPPSGSGFVLTFPATSQATLPA